MAIIGKIVGKTCFYFCFFVEAVVTEVIIFVKSIDQWSPIKK
jgi:hypothetical protein